MDWKHRSTEDARKALSNFCKAVGTHGDHSVHIFTVPVDQDRDADMILSDVIAERDALRELLKRLIKADFDTKTTDHFQRTGEARRLLGMDAPVEHESKQK